MSREVTFSLSEEDYIAANRDWFTKAGLRRRALIWMGSLLLFTGMAGFVGAWIDGDGMEDGLYAGVGFILITIVALLSCHAACSAMLSWSARRVYRQQKSFGQPWSYAWSEEGLEFRSPTATARFAWPDLWRWSEGSQGFLFMVNERSFFPIPSRALTVAQADDLRELVGRLGPLRL
jgi:hypothetical protein